MTVKTAETPSLRRWPVSTIVFWSLLAVGCGVRLYLAAGGIIPPNSDQGIVYLMAVRVSDGEFPAFFWGQSYGGTALSWLAGLVMLVTGPHRIVLDILSIAFVAGAAWFLREAVADGFGRRAGDFAGMFFFFPSFAYLVISILDPGFYGPTLFFGLGALWLAVRIVRVGGAWRWLAAGVFAGLALWQSPMGAAYALPAVVMVAIRRREWKGYLLGIGGAIVGASPWLVATLFQHSSTFTPIGQGFQPRSFIRLFTQVIPGSLMGGFYPPWNLLVGGFCFALVVLLLIVAVAKRDGGMIALGIGSVLCAIAVVVGAGALLDVDHGRYGFFLLPALAASLGWLATRLPVVPYVVAASLLALTLLQSVHQSTGEPLAARMSTLSQLREVEQFLDDKGIDNGYGDYWIAYRMTADTNQAIRLAALNPRRFEPYEIAAAASRPTTMVVFAGKDSDLLLQQAWVPEHTRTQIGSFAVYRFEEPFDPFGSIQNGNSVLWPIPNL